MDKGENSYRRFLKGDEEAFREIIELYKNSLIFFINRYVQDYDVAEDIAEDTFVQLIIHRHRYNFKTSLKTYLFTIGRNKAVSYLRHASRRTEVPVESIEVPDGEDLEEKLLREERKLALYRALEELKEEYRVVLHLVYFEGMSYEEAGRVMKKSVKQVTNLVYRAKKALRDRLGKDELFDENK